MPPGFETARRPELTLRQLHQAWDPRRWPEASLFCVLARSAYCRIDKLPHATPVLASLLPGRGTALTDDEWALLETHTGADEYSAPRRLAFARTSTIDTAVWSSVLRYCVTCLRCGYHATLFQHQGIDRCPLHQEPLVSDCYRCGRAVAPRMSTTCRLSFQCPACAQTLLNEPGIRLGYLAGEAEARVADLRARIEPVTAMHFEQCRTPGPSFGPSIAAARMAARFSIWADGAPFLRFRQELLALSMEHEEETRENLAENGECACLWHSQAAALRWLVLSTPHAVQQEVADLAARMWGQQGGARLRDERSVLSVAIVKAAHLCGLLRDLASQTPAVTPAQSGGDPGPHAALSFSRSQWQQLNKRLLVLEIWALCACCLLQAARLCRLADYSWSDAAPPIVWAPAWRIERRDGVAIARIRARFDEAGMRRLFRRYAHARLSSEAPTGAYGETIVRARQIGAAD